MFPLSLLYYHPAKKPSFWLWFAHLILVRGPIHGCLQNSHICTWFRGIFYVWLSFSMYGQPYMWKNDRFLCGLKHPNPCPYAVVLRTDAYRATNKVFKGNNLSKFWFFVQDGVRVEGKRAWWCGGSRIRWSHGPTSITGMWFIQVLVSRKPEGQTKNTPAATGLLGSRIWDISDRWDVTQHGGWGHIFYHCCLNEERWWTFDIMGKETGWPYMST